MAKQANVISHWHQLIENFQGSSLAFYQSIEAGAQARAIPEIHNARIEHKEGGLASANRQYLRIHRGKHAFDICAAPFGTGFFVSWWFTEPPLPFAMLWLLSARGVHVRLTYKGRKRRLRFESYTGQHLFGKHSPRVPSLLAATKSFYGEWVNAWEPAPISLIAFSPRTNASAAFGKPRSLIL
jgi:hypothetical protein